MRPRGRRHSAPLEILKSRRNVARLGDSGTPTKVREWSPAAIELRVRRSGLIFLFGPELAARAVKKEGPSARRALRGSEAAIKLRLHFVWPCRGPGSAVTRFLACSRRRRSLGLELLTACWPLVHRL